MTSPAPSLATLLGASVLLAGCGRPMSARHVDAHPGHDEDHRLDEATRFEEGRGLSLDPAVATALALRTAGVEERPLRAEMTLLARVFATSPRVLATALVPMAEAETFVRRKFAGATLVRIDHATAAATQLVDVILALDRMPPPAPGEFVELMLTAEPVKARSVPRSAVLDTATGTFVYVVEGGHYRRTAVKTGARSSEFVEIAAGLDEGDEVVVSPVEQLWLTELRLTKGGGHSH